MNSFMRFLRKTTKDLLLTPARIEAIEKIDPEHIYVENIRAVFGFTTPVARALCDLAVQQGILQRRVEVRCPDETAAAYAPSVEDLPRMVSCWCEVNGNYEERSFETQSLKHYYFYVYRQGGLA